MVRNNLARLNASLGLAREMACINLAILSKANAIVRGAGAHKSREINPCQGFPLRGASSEEARLKRD